MKTVRLELRPIEVTEAERLIEEDEATDDIRLNLNESTGEWHIVGDDEHNVYDFLCDVIGELDAEAVCYD